MPVNVFPFYALDTLLDIPMKVVFLFCVGVSSAGYDFCAHILP